MSPPKIVRPKPAPKAVKPKPVKAPKPAKPIKVAKVAKAPKPAKIKPAGRKGKAALWTLPEPSDRLAVLAAALRTHPDATVPPRTAKLLQAGIAKMAQKVVEEAAEVAIDAVRLERSSVILETADLLYNLTVLLSALDIHPSAVWAEMDRRQQMLGIAEKLPKEGGPAATPPATPAESP